MSLSNAERQAKYREKRKAGRAGELRLNQFISSEAHSSMVLLAKRYGVTQREILEKVLTVEFQKVVKSLEPDSDEWREFFGSETEED